MNVRTRAGQAASPGESPRTPLSLPTAAAIYLALAVLYFLPAFLPGQHIYGTDYLVGGYFFHEFISARFAAGELPKWVPHVYGGLPLFANPGSTYFPFRFVADLIFPVSKIWPTLFVIHFTLAGVGMYLLARELGVRAWVAFVAGLAFQFTGLTMSWVLAGHEGRIIVATLTPLLFFLLHRGIRTARAAPFAGAAATIGFALLTFQIQSSYYLLLGAALWSAFVIWHLETHRDGRRLVRVLALGVGAVAFAFVMAAVNFLPFLDYVEQSPRGGAGGRGYEYSVSWSMPVSEIVALAVPEHTGHLETYRGTNPMKLHTEYVGAVVLMLTALGFLFVRRNRYWWFFIALALFGLSISFGGATPLYRLYYELLPGTKKFRAPAISFFLVSFSLTCLSALALEAVARLREERDAARARATRGGETAGPLDRAVWVLLGVVVLGMLGGAAASSNPGAGSLAYRFALFAAAAALLIWLWLRGSLQRTGFVALLALLTVVDLWIVDRKFFETVPSPEEMFAADDVASFLQSQPGRDRVWVLPFPAGQTYRGQSGNYLMRFDIDQAGGEHGNQLQRWNQYVGAGEQTYVDWHNFLESPTMMDAANIRYIVSGVPLDAAGLREVHRGTAVVYENPNALPRAYLVPRVERVEADDGALQRMRQPGFDPRSVAFVNSETPIQLPAEPLSGDAEVTSYTPDEVRVRVNASRDALLVLADNFYAGWTARVGERVVPIVRANHALRGVVVPRGQHEVVFRYEPADLRTGFVLYLLTMGLLAGYALFLLVRWKRAPEPSAG